MTSYWAANGLNHRSASGGRPLIGPTPLVAEAVWLRETPAIVVQKRTMKSEPIVRAITPKNVTTVAAWVRCISAEMKRPERTKTDRGREQDDVARSTSSGPTPPNTNTIAVSGIEATIRMNT